MQMPSTAQAGRPPRSGDPELAKLLSVLNLSHYEDAFAGEEISLELAQKLSNDELKDLGLPLGARKLLLEEFAKMNRLNPELLQQQQRMVRLECYLHYCLSLSVLFFVLTDLIEAQSPMHAALPQASFQAQQMVFMQMGGGHAAPVAAAAAAGSASASPGHVQAGGMTFHGSAHMQNQGDVVAHDKFCTLH